jgi:3-hydroxybutyryl-CoA dehydratase
MKLGDTAAVERIFTGQDVAAYVELTGAPVHANELPEALVGALFSYLLGVHLPGHGTRYLKQDSTFLESARIAERLRASVSVTRIRPDKGLIDLETLCHRSDGTLICQGRALVLAAPAMLDTQG